ncbi:MAG: glutaredoxin family protein [Burkholderiales bacterium]|nr:glutaredoxin family protein [Nitrosomonas sp.]MCP5273635.1 glutaredoxin family protein [Burkholderiales bacterium]
MILALEERQKQVPFDFQVIDIDTDSDLVARFNDRIPVLMSYSDQIEICHFHFDNAAFDDYLARFR